MSTESKEAGGNEIDGLNLSQFAEPEEIAELMKKEDPVGDKSEKDATDTSANPDDGDDGDDSDDGDDDQRAVRSQEEQEAATPEAREKAREKKKQERLNQRQRQREKIQTLERQLANSIADKQAMEQRLSALESSQTGTQFATLEQHELQAKAIEKQLKDIIADASTKGDGERVAEATQGLIEVRERQKMIEQAKEGLKARSAHPKSQPLDTEVVNHARAFMAKATWYKGPKGTDPDSRVLTALDNSLTAEGWDPKSESYWQELEARASKYLSHRFKGGERGQKDSKDDPNGGDSTHNGAQDRQRRSPVAGGSNDSGGGGSDSKTYRISASRVQAMKEAGIWDDPKRRASAIKRYQEYDKQNA